MADGERVVFPVWHEYTATVNGWEAIEFPRLLGVFSTREAAEEAAAEAAALPGFDGVLGDIDENAGLMVDEVPLDHRGWDSGFVTMYDEESEA